MYRNGHLRKRAAGLGHSAAGASCDRRIMDPRAQALQVLAEVTLSGICLSSV